MTTWLDEYSFIIGSEIMKNSGGRIRDVHGAMARMSLICVSKLDESRLIPAGEHSTYRFEADLYPFFADSFRYKRCGIRLTAGYRHAIKDLKPTNAHLLAVTEHFASKDYTYIDCPSGTFAIGEGAEIRAIFVKTANVVDAKAPRSVMTSEPLRVDAIVGRPGIPTRQRLSWAFGLRDVKEFQTPSDETLSPPCDLPSVMIADAERDFQQVIGEIEATAALAIAYARYHEGTSLASALPKIPIGHSALRRTVPDRARTMFDILELKTGRGPPDAGAQTCH